MSLAFVAACLIGNFLEEIESERFPMFRTLSKLISIAGLGDLLANAERITVLCPTNKAFERAGIKVVREHVTLNGAELDTDTLKKVLMRHVIRFEQHSLDHAGAVQTLSQETLMFDTDEDGRTTVSHGQTSACVLMQGFLSSNARFAAIGRVLL